MTELTYIFLVISKKIQSMTEKKNSQGVVAQHSEIYKYHSCTPCHNISHYEFFRKKLISTTCTWHGTLPVIAQELW